MTNILWTCFAVKDTPADSFHCTHKYLGEQNELNEYHIQEIIEKFFFGEFRFVLPMKFGNVDYFGERYSRAYVLSDFGYKDQLFLDLRFKLDAFRKDNFEHWVPHITTNASLSSTSIKFDRFCLMKNNDELLTFKI